MQAREQARGAIQDAARAATEEASRRQEELGRELAETVKAAEENIEDAKRDAVSGIRQAAVEAAASATERLIGVKPLDPAAGAAVDKAFEARALETGK